jgi:hypothetical protein
MAGKSRLVKPENTLKKKAGSGGFNEKDLVKAQSMIENNEIDFRPLGADLLKELDEVLADIRAGKIDLAGSLGNIMYPMMQLKSQGGLFKYPLITQISHLMLDFLESITEADEDILEITGAYRRTIHAVLTLEIKGKDTKEGRDLCLALRDAFERYYKVSRKKVATA